MYFEYITKGRPWKPHYTHVSSLPGKKAEASESLIILSYVNVFLGCFLGCLCVFFYWFKYYAGVSIVSRRTGFLFLNKKNVMSKHTNVFSVPPSCPSGTAERPSELMLCTWYQHCGGRFPCCQARGIETKVGQKQRGNPSGHQGERGSASHSFPKFYLKTDFIPFSCWLVLFGCYFSRYTFFFF